MGGFIGIVMYLHVIHSVARKILNTRFQIVGNVALKQEEDSKKTNENITEIEIEIDLEKKKSDSDKTIGEFFNGVDALY